MIVEVPYLYPVVGKTKLQRHNRPILALTSVFCHVEEYSEQLTSWNFGEMFHHPRESMYQYKGEIYLPLDNEKKDGFQHYRHFILSNKLYKLNDLRFPFDLGVIKKKNRYDYQNHEGIEDIELEENIIIANHTSAKADIGKSIQKRMEMALCDKNSGHIIFKTQGPFLYFSIREAPNLKMIKDSLHWSFEDRFGFPFARKENNFYHSFKIPFACFPTLLNDKYKGIVHYTIQQEQEIKINFMNSTSFFSLKDMDKCLKSNLRKIIFNKVQQLQRPNDFLETTSKLEVSKFVDWRDIIDSMTNLVPNMPIDALDPDHYISDPERLDDFLKLEEELVNSIVGIENIPDKEGFYRFRDMKKNLNFIKDLFMETVEIHQIQKEKMESFLHIKL